MPTKARASIVKRGRKKGHHAPLKMTVGDWYVVCETFTNLKVKMGQSAFLRSSLSGNVLTGTRSEQGSFGKKLKMFQSGLLKNTNAKRIRKRSYEAIEEKLVNYLKLREERYKRDKLGTSVLLLQEKCMQWARDLELHDFKCSKGWLYNTLNTHGIERINLHGEADDLSDEEVAAVMGPWRNELRELMEEKQVGPSCLYNADQTGLFYQKLPNSFTYKKRIRNILKVQNR